MHRRTAWLRGFLAVEHERQRLVLHHHRLGRVLGERARVGDHGGDPFAGIARNVDRERPARHVGRVEAGHQRQRRGRKLAAVEHVVHARHRQRRGLVDGHDARGGMRRGHQRHVLRARQRDIGGEAALADHKAAVLAHPAIRRHVAKFFRGAHGAGAGRFCPRMRSAASAIGLDDLRIAGAAADVGGNGLDDVVAGRRGIAREQRVRGEDHCRRAIAALHAVGLTERILQRRSSPGPGASPSMVVMA